MRLRTPCLLLVLILLLMSNIALAQTPDYAKSTDWVYVEPRPVLAVDVFFLLPTLYKPSTPDAVFADINDAKMRAKAGPYLQQVSGVFTRDCNVFAPHYRQADANRVLNKPLAEQEALIKQLPLTDAVAALDYYFEHFNNGRPFILAGYSQGSFLIRYILSDYMRRHPDRYARMIAAYAIGYGIDRQYLKDNPHLRFAKTDDDLGVIISFNTEAPGLTVPNTFTIGHSLSINPISWTRSARYAPAALSKGALLPDSNGINVRVPHFADAQVDRERGTILTNIDIDKFSAKRPGGPVPRGMYHGHDYNLYYFDLKANVHTRVRAYLRQQATQLEPAA